MSRLSKSERVSLWLDRLHRFSLTSQSAAEFCQSEGVSLPSFYQWKRRLSPLVSKPAARRSTTAKSNVFTELSVTSMALPTRIQLTADIVIELGSEQATVATVVDRVLAQCWNRSVNEQRSC